MDQVIRQAFKVKQSRDSEESKSVVLEVDTTGATEEILLGLAMKDVVITQQRKMREPKVYKDLKDGEVVRVNLIDFAPRGARVDPMQVARQALASRLEACTSEKERKEVTDHFIHKGGILPLKEKAA